MSNNVVRLFAVACLTSAAFVGSASAQTTSDDAMRRLEAKIDALAKENSSLRSRLTRVEGEPRAAKPKQEQGYVGPIGKPGSEPTPQQVNAARESFAADLPVAVKYAPPPRPACAQFGGFYAGVNAGANYLTSDWKDQDNFGGLITGLNATEGTNSKAGWNAGGQIGWNYQSGCTIWGVVADMSWANTKAEADYRSFPGGIPGLAPGTLTATSELKWFGTARTRAGVVVDNLLLYVTGGFAFAGFDRTLAYDNPFIPAVPALRRTATFNDDSSRVGFVVGAGTEWNLGNNWSFGSEFLYMGFQKDETSFTCSGSSCPLVLPASNNYRYTFNDSVWVARFNLNYRFGDYGKGPVLAKY